MAKSKKVFEVAPQYGNPSGRYNLILTPRGHKGSSLLTTCGSRKAAHLFSQLEASRRLLSHPTATDGQ
jgi:hypothetical protein